MLDEHWEFNLVSLTVQFLSTSWQLFSLALQAKLFMSTKRVSEKYCFFDFKKKEKKMLDIELFRADKGGNPETIKESQRRRFADESLVDKVIEADNVWRKRMCCVTFKRSLFSF